MAEMQVVTLMGRLAADAEMKFTPGGTTLCSFKIPVTIKRKEREITTWWGCTIWGERATKLAEYLTKGKGVVIVGELAEIQVYQDKKSGEWKPSPQVTVNTIQFTPEKRDAAAAAGEGGQESVDESEIPF